MDPTLKANVDTANQEATSIQQNIPGLLSGLKSNLNSIFTRDNPMFAERENALKTFLNTPSQTRSSLLPQNLPMVEGSNLNLSPTQQNAITTASRNAALVPLAGLNQSIVGQSGNIGDMLSNASNIYQTQAEIAKQKALNALNLYKTGIDEYNALTARQRANEGSGGGDLGSTLAAILGQTQQERPDPSQFDEPDVDTNTELATNRTIDIPGMGQIQSYTSPPLPSPGRWNPFAQLAAIPELLFGRRSQSVDQPATSLNLLGIGSNTGPFRQ